MVYYLAGEKEGICSKVQKLKKSFWKSGEKIEILFLESALMNTYFISPPRIYHWEKMLFDKKYEGDNFMDILSQYNPNRGISGNCLSTETYQWSGDSFCWSGQTAF